MFWVSPGTHKVRYVYTCIAYIHNIHICIFPACLPAHTHTHTHCLPSMCAYHVWIPCVLTMCAYHAMHNVTLQMQKKIQKLEARIESHGQLLRKIELLEARIERLDAYHVC